MKLMRKEVNRRLFAKARNQGKKMQEKQRVQKKSPMFTKEERKGGTCRVPLTESAGGQGLFGSYLNISAESWGSEREKKPKRPVGDCNSLLRLPGRSESPTLGLGTGRPSLDSEGEREGVLGDRTGVVATGGEAEQKNSSSENAKWMGAKSLKR